MYTKDLSKTIVPLYCKTQIGGQKYFNKEDIELVKKKKEILKDVLELNLPLESNYVVIETDASELSW